eukprot:SAG31_NODE_6932_length_1845_cov_1.213058_3_plen_105_part_00
MYLKELDLSDNLFKRFPREVCEIKSLEVILANDGKRLYAPNALAACVQTLRLSGNLIRRVEPKHNVRRMQNLKELHLDGNRIEVLCDDFGALSVRCSAPCFSAV